MQRTIFDWEVFPNIAFALFKPYLDDTAKIQRLEIREQVPTEAQRSFLVQKMTQCELIGFNSNGYDNCINRLVVAGATCKDIYEFSRRLIALKEAQHWVIEADIMQRLPFKNQVPQWYQCNTVDLINYIPNRPSLKVLMARLHLPSIIDGVVPFDQPINELDLKQVAIPYCRNDLYGTEGVMQENEEEYEMRKALAEKFNLRLLSAAPPEIARLVISNLYSRATGISMAQLKESASWNKDAEFIYQPPEKLKPLLVTKATMDLLNRLQATPFVVRGGALVQSPRNIKIKVTDILSVTCGSGGIHSIDAAGSFRTTEERTIADYDATSLYPMLIMLFGLVPQHFDTQVYISIYNQLVEMRLAAKKAGDKVLSNAIKLIINSAFGDLGNQWSVLYDPQACMQVTCTGQLVLVSLIERVSGFCEPISCNTDGITLDIPIENAQIVDDLIKEWSSEVGLNMEKVIYKTYNRKDVNNYVAITEELEVKTKGCFGISKGRVDLKSNQTEIIVRRAVVSKLLNGVPLEDTIKSCTDLTQFLHFKKASAGATVNGTPVGRMVRCYRTTKEPDQILSLPTEKSGSKNMYKAHRYVGVLPTNMDQLPEDLDTEAYVDEANDLYGIITSKVDYETATLANDLLVQGVPIIPASKYFIKGKRTFKKYNDFNDFLSAIIVVQLGGVGRVFIADEVFETDAENEVLWDDGELFLQRASNEEMFKLARKTLKRTGVFSGKWDLFAKKIIQAKEDTTLVGQE